MPNNLELLFEEPWPDPNISGKPYLPHLEPYVTADIPPEFKKTTLLELVKTVSKLPEDAAVKLIEFGSVWLDSRPCFQADKKLADCGLFRLNPPRYEPEIFYTASTERIVFEDEALLVYNKESGRPSQSVPHDAHNNVLAALERYLKLRGDEHPLWLMHRLDSDTSGLLILAKSKLAAGRMGKAFQNSLVHKEYMALGYGDKKIPQGAFNVKTFIYKDKGRYYNRRQPPGLFANSDFKIINKEGDKILFQVSPLTGRTHQIRLHLQHIGWPIIGDRLYGGHVPAARLMLSAHALRFPHPLSGKVMELRLPDRYENP